MHFLRNVLAAVPKGSAEMVLAAIRTVFAQPNAAHVHEQFEVIVGILGRQLPKVEAMMRAAKEDLLAFTAFPQPHWRKVWSNNPVRHEAPRNRGEVRVLPCWAVAAA